MFLKSLELNGFKSFAQKTTLEFPAGITAVVGPNGAGKSNIIDAIRWLLGERESKNLRTAKAEDLIFNGTPQKPRVSMAQAALYFDNNSGFFPVDFKEVLVVRRVGRDGISQYFLNKAEARLKDVIDFFSRSRLGTKGLTIINQGGSDSFVKASLEERRLMIEEILGLKEYQVKKTEAERKLKNSFLNLERVKAVIGEVTPRLRMLKRQTNKWAKRLELQKELRAFEDNYFSYKLKEIEENREEIEPALISLEKQINEKQKELKILELELKKIESRPEIYQDLKKIKHQQNELSIERSQIQKEIGRLEAKLELFSVNGSDASKILKNEDLFSLINEIKQILEESLGQLNLEKLKSVIKELIEKIVGFLNPVKIKDFKSKELSELEKFKNDLMSKFDALEENLEKLESEETGITDSLEEFNKHFQKAFELAETKREELKILEEKKNKILFEKERLNLKFQDVENQLAQIGRTIKELNFKTAQPIKEIEISTIEPRMLKLRSELSSIGEIDESLIKETQEVEAHYDFLTSQSKDLEKATVDLKNLILELNEKIHFEFNTSLRLINEEFNKFFRMMFGGGFAKLKIKNPRFVKAKQESEKNKNNEDEGNEENEENEEVIVNNNEQKQSIGVEIDLSLPKRRITSLDMLSGGEKSLVSIAALFALVSISPPPFLVLDEIDAALDENNSRRFSNLIKEFSKKTQFIIVTHNRVIMEAADVLYGVTLGEDGTSRILSLKLE